jgi:hypothetical protein
MPLREIAVWNRFQVGTFCKVRARIEGQMMWISVFAIAITSFVAFSVAAILLQYMSERRPSQG